MSLCWSISALRRIVVDSTTISIWGDNELFIEVQDDLYRGGHLGFWAYENNQQVSFDNIAVESEHLENCTNDLDDDDDGEVDCNDTD